MEKEKLNDIEDFEDDEELEEVEPDEEIEDEVDDEESTDEEEVEETEPEKNPENQVIKDEKDRVLAKQQNRINAERRKQEKAKREAELERKGYNQALKENVNGINPYTNKPIKDDTDMEIYLEMRELESKGKDPINDYADYVAEKSRKLKEEQLAKKQQEDYATKDIDSFNKEYPDIDINLLMKDEHFLAFADGKIGNKPLTEVYKKFLEFETFYEKKAEDESTERAVKKFARVQSNMGSMKSNNNNVKKVSYKNMSDEDFEKELLKVKRQSY